MSGRYIYFPLLNEQSEAASAVSGILCSACMYKSRIQKCSEYSSFCSNNNNNGCCKMWLRSLSGPLSEPVTCEELLLYFFPRTIHYHGDQQTWYVSNNTCSCIVLAEGLKLREQFKLICLTNTTSIANPCFVLFVHVHKSTNKILIPVKQNDTTYKEHNKVSWKGFNWLLSFPIETVYVRCTKARLKSSKTFSII